MKVVNSLQDIAAVFVSADEVRPSRGAMTRDLIRIVGDTYAFAIRPQIPEGVAPNLIPAFVFQSGELNTEEGKIPIQSLTITNEGTAVTSTDTELAEQVLDHYIDLMERELGFRVKGATQRRVYQSAVIVDFDPPIEDMAQIFSDIEKILNDAMPRPDYPFKFKRLAFGYGDLPNPFTASISLDPVQKADFVIERRANEPYSRNRYFCSSMSRTPDHVRLLERIEKALAGGARSTRR